MRLIRVHVTAPLAAGATIALRGTAANHVRRVLRLREGDALALFNGDGLDYPARVRASAGGAVTVAVEGSAPARAESPLAVRLVQGIARAERMDLVVQKATELGVGGIQPVATARSVVRLDAGTAARKRTHWQAVAIAACEQCGRARVPAVAEPVPWQAWLGVPPATAALRLLLAADAARSLVDAARGAHEVELLVGPEGGLEDAEREAAVRAGYVACRLGPRILRTETAAIAAIAALQATGGDLGPARPGEAQQPAADRT